MKSLYLLGCFLLIGLLLLACNQGDDAPTPDVEATVRVAVEATAQVAVKATVQAATAATTQTMAAQPTSTPEPVLSEDDRLRPFRSYPAPTGEAGFRLYYQKRCYPGCHTLDSDSDQVQS
jgi:hypothetical protein